MTFPNSSTARINGQKPKYLKNLIGKFIGKAEQQFLS